METIQFGTDGWRAVIAEGFTFASVRRAGRGLAAWLKEQPFRRSAEVVVGFDTRFLSEAFARECAWVLAEEGFQPVLGALPVPTPCVSWNVRRRQACCGVVITSSHNPAQYNGLKIKLDKGCSAFAAQTARVAEAAGRAPDRAPAKRPALPRPDLAGPYLEALQGQVRFDLIRSSPLKVVLDSMHGSGGDLLAGRLAGGRLKALPLREKPDPLFGGVQPEPIGENLKALSDEVVRQKAGAGLALDGDGDRMGLVDERGGVVNAHQVLGLFLHHLVTRRGEYGEVVRTFSGTQLVDRLCRAFDLKLHETPIGFKHIAEIMLRRPVLVAGEESNGFGFGSHLPERDGLLSSLLTLEILATARKPLSLLVKELRREYGAFHYERVDLPISGGARPGHVGAFLRGWHPGSVAGLRVVERSDLDGSKFLLEGGAWLLLRPSGTEPLVRLYCEASSAPQVEEILRAGREALEAFA